MGVALDWTSGSHWGGSHEPCVICGELTFLVSDRGRPCHKECAERWYDAHPHVEPFGPHWRT
ncbi:hypothetical protein [Yinghuangia soli]|uniref:Uncharacterized protein n=1 Tax=Yinghuangia soli TaxID=2908204 RepID=A0AA41Q4S6_9ACTN|nr:hypothetical protein [Yinghuangia soli]MCF2531326.1 hypothetical protein [Yinghuangia soli]